MYKHLYAHTYTCCSLPNPSVTSKCWGIRTDKAPTPPSSVVECCYATYLNNKLMYIHWNKHCTIFYVNIFGPSSSIDHFCFNSFCSCNPQTDDNKKPQSVWNNLGRAAIRQEKRVHFNLETINAKNSSCENGQPCRPKEEELKELEEKIEDMKDQLRAALVRKSQLMVILQPRCNHTQAKTQANRW